MAGGVMPPSFLGHIQYAILRDLKRGRRTRTSLARAIGSTPSQVSTSIYDLRKRGYVIETSHRGYVLRHDPRNRA
jgi:biotin operon repressor